MKGVVIIHCDELGMPISVFSPLFLLRSTSGWSDSPIHGFTKERASQVKICERCYHRLKCLTEDDDKDLCFTVVVCYSSKKGFRDINSFDDFVSWHYHELYSLLMNTSKFQEYLKRPHAVAYEKMFPFSDEED